MARILHIKQCVIEKKEESNKKRVLAVIVTVITLSPVFGSVLKAVKKNDANRHIEGFELWLKTGSLSEVKNGVQS